MKSRILLVLIFSVLSTQLDAQDILRRIGQSVGKAVQKEVVKKVKESKNNRRQQQASQARQASQTLQGFPLSGCRQFTALARILAQEVLPVPREPVNR